FVLSLMRKHILSHATTKLDIILSTKVFRKLTHLPIGFFTKRQTGDTVVRIKELESIRSFVSGYGLTVLIDFPFSLIILAVMFMFSAEITLIAILGIIMFFVVYGVVNPFLKERLHQKHKMTVDNQSYLVEAVR
ncbi:ABC transporter transmembrane domain-containing protein, partial [Thioclava sp. JE_KL1]